MTSVAVAAPRARLAARILYDGSKSVRGPRSFWGTDFFLTVRSGISEVYSGAMMSIRALGFLLGGTVLVSEA